MGKAGNVVGILFFVTTIFATLIFLYLSTGIYYCKLYGNFSY